MPLASEPLSTSMQAIMYAGDVVFPVSGALNAARHRMDVLSFVLIGTIAVIGGGTLRDLLMGRTVWWTRDPFELLLCMGAALVTYFFIKTDISNRKWMVWSDALGLACFAVVGCHMASRDGAELWDPRGQLWPGSAGADLRSRVAFVRVMAPELCSRS